MHLCIYFSVCFIVCKCSVYAETILDRRQLQPTCNLHINTLDSTQLKS